MTSTSMEGSVYSSHPDSPHAVHYHDGPPLVSNSPQPDIFPCASPQFDKQLASCHSLQRQTSCQSIQDSVTSCHRHAHNMHDSMTSFHSLLLPSHGFHTCQWHMYNSADHSSTTSCCEKPNPFTLQYQQDREKDPLCRETEQQDFPRNTLPRHHSTVGRRGAIGRNSSLQEDGLLGSDTTGQKSRPFPVKQGDIVSYSVTVSHKGSSIIKECVCLFVTVMLHVMKAVIKHSLSPQ